MMCPQRLDDDGRMFRANEAGILLVRNEVPDLLATDRDVAMVSAGELSVVHGAREE
jgi:hypothetical protein